MAHTPDSRWFRRQWGTASGQGESLRGRNSCTSLDLVARDTGIRTGGWNNPLHIADLLPTLAEVIGFHLPQLDGESQWQSLTSGRQKQRRSLIVANMGSEALIDWPWKLVKDAPLPFVPAIFADDDYYLYNLAQDPGETTDMTEAHPGRI